ncbi:hypothetical protein DN069_01735 [Streptacidiphilus pinicola]|uniref:Uncharacterized protein n=1 Tax=Streptacidiphilus pinicola TaxID=2219663 RepID=A0A2X0IV46_9ACTN|nr:RICIN domain-containing protein [Streptacidiphilus pinicola]RAG87281.1 hypothetical protein DN069_01735 [Streptacidiphilus pinicola]
MIRQVCSRPRLSLVLAGGTAALLASAGTVAAAPGPGPGSASARPLAAAAADPVSLSGWNLAVPVDSSGGTSGDAMTISPATLYPPYLTQDSGGALHLWAPANGARLGISLHARTELRGPGTFVLGQGSAGLEETAAVTQLPDNSHDIIIGQMFPTGTTPFAMLHYQSGKVYGYIHGQSQEYVLMSGIPLGATFQDSIEANGDTVTFSVTYNGQTSSLDATNIDSFIGDTMHFQAGDYQQDLSDNPSTDGGAVTFSALDQYGVPGGSSGPGGGGGGGGTGFPTGYHQLVVQNSGLCADVNNNSTADNAVIDQWTCKTSGTANQEFQFVPVANGYGELQNENSGSDVVVQGASTAQGAKVVQYTQNGSANGLWRPIRQSDGTWQFQNQNSGLCLDQAGAVSTVGVQFDQWPCKSGTGDNQDFAAQ